MRAKLSSAYAFLLVALAAGSASATFLSGKTVEYQYLYTTITSPYAIADNGNKLVGAGVEVSNVADGLATMDISDTNILINFSETASFNLVGTFNGFRITDIFTAIPDFAGVTINPFTNMVGLDASDITFDADNIWVNWRGLAFTSNTFVSLDLTAVPEPSTALLLGGGLIGLAAHRRRRKA